MRKLLALLLFPVAALAAYTPGVINIPSPTRAGDVPFWNGSIWTSLAGNNSGTLCLTENSSGVPTWASCLTGGTGITAVGTFDSQAKVAAGLATDGSTLWAQSADATHPGMMNTSTQTFAGAKTYTGQQNFAAGTTSIAPFNLATGVAKTSCSTGDMLMTTTHLSICVSGTYYQLDQQGGLTSIANNRVLANISGSSAVPAATSGSALLDALFGSTPGQILCRNGSVWTVLGGGTSGYFLQTTGTSTCPSWAAAPTSGNIASAVDYQRSLNSGFDFTPTKLNTKIILSGPLTYGTLEVPGAFSDGDQWTFYSLYEVTAISAFPGGTNKNAPLYMAAGTTYTATYDGSTSTWVWSW